MKFKFLYLLLMSGFMLFSLACGDKDKDTDNDTKPPIVVPPVVEPEEKGNLAGHRKIILDSPFDAPVVTYQLRNASTKSKNPVNWSLWGSNDSENWKLLDERLDQTFLSHYTEKECVVQEPGKYSKYALIVALPSKDTITTLAPYAIKMFQKDLSEGWENFSYPTIEFNDRNPETTGSQIYKNVVYDPVNYIKYHALLVCRTLFWTADNPQDRYNIQKITYNLEDYDGVSGKSGGPPHITIALSTRWLGGVGGSMNPKEFNDEIRGCLMHEVTHGYQHEPKGCGGYQGGTEFFAAIEGMADAVRIDANLPSKGSKPNPNGNWKDGYSNTGFFIQWFRTKDPDAMRKFHDSMRTINPWSFDAGVKAVFGPQTTIDGLWSEYVQFLADNPSYHHYQE